MPEATSTPSPRLFAASDRPWLRRALRHAGLAAMALYFDFALLVLALRLFVLPQI